MGEFEITKMVRELRDGTVYAFQAGEKISLDLAVRLGLTEPAASGLTAVAAVKPPATPLAAKAAKPAAKKGAEG